MNRPRWRTLPPLSLIAVAMGSVTGCESREPSTTCVATSNCAPGFACVGGRCEWPGTRVEAGDGGASQPDASQSLGEPTDAGENSQPGPVSGGMFPVSVVVAEADEGSPSDSIAPGPLSTDGSRIVDSQGSAIRLSGIGWWGIETDRHIPSGLHRRPLRDLLQLIRDLGFNAIRITFSAEALAQPPIAAGQWLSNFHNPDLVGKTPLEILDVLIAHCRVLGLRVLLAHTQIHAKTGDRSNEGLWYDATYSENDWLRDWQVLAQRYGDDWTVLGADLRNEPYAASWGSGGADDWAAAAERGARAVHEIAPDWLVFVQGVHRHGGATTGWGENFRGFWSRPIRISRMNKLVLSPHVYGPHQHAQQIFSSPEFPDHLPEWWRDNWGFLQFDRGLPVVIGEFDFAPAHQEDSQWRDRFLRVIDGDADVDGTRELPVDHPGTSWFLWPLRVTDPGRGILEDDWTTVREDKLAILRPLMSPHRAAQRSLTLTLAPTATQQRIRIETEDGSALAGEDYLPLSQSIELHPGQSTTVVVPIIPDANVEDDEVLRVRLRLEQPSPGAPIESVVDVRIIDDD